MTEPREQESHSQIIHVFIPAFSRPSVPLLPSFKEPVPGDKLSGSSFPGPRSPEGSIGRGLSSSSKRIYIYHYSQSRYNRRQSVSACFYTLAATYASINSLSASPNGSYRSHRICKGDFFLQGVFNCSVLDGEWVT